MPTDTSMLAILRRIPFPGKEAKELWAAVAPYAKEVIAQFNLKPTTIGAMPAVARPMAMAEVSFVDLGIKGGIRVPHIHYANKIYLLNEDQWAVFSRQVVADARAKLAKAKSLGFDETVLLADVAQSLNV